MFTKLSKTLFTRFFHRFIFLVVICGFTSLSYTTHASYNNKTKFLKSFNRWHVFEKKFVRDDGTREKRCVCISHPSASLGFSGFRDIPHLVFTQVNKDNYTTSLYTGFVIDKNKPIELSTGKNKFFLQVYRDFFAHTYNSSDDVNIVNAVLKNRQTLITRITSNTGDIANDHYDFKGLDKAMQYMHESCS